VLPFLIIPLEVTMAVGDSVELKARVNPDYDCIIESRFDWRAAPSGIVIIHKLTDTTAMMSGIARGRASAVATSISKYPKTEAIVVTVE
jgi:hypothetical protein